MEITEQDVMLIKNELYLSLLKFSDDSLSEEELRKIADKTITLESLQNKAFAHKGTNWLARLILETIHKDK